MSRDDARRAARLEIGRVDQVKEHVRDVRVGAWLDALRQDVRFGVRTLIRRPGFATDRRTDARRWHGRDDGDVQSHRQRPPEAASVPRTRPIDDGVGGAPPFQPATNRSGAVELCRLAAAGAGLRKSGGIRQRIRQPDRGRDAGTVGRRPGDAESVPDSGCRPARRPLVRDARRLPGTDRSRDPELRVVAAPLRRRSRHRRADDSPGWPASPGCWRHASWLPVSPRGRPGLDARRLFARAGVFSRVAHSSCLSLVV